MSVPEVSPIARVELDAAELVAKYPPRFTHSNKRVVQGTRLESTEQLRKLIEGEKIGASVTLTFVRPSTGERREITVELEKRPPGEE